MPIEEEDVVDGEGMVVEYEVRDAGIGSSTGVKVLLKWKISSAESGIVARGCPTPCGLWPGFLPSSGDCCWELFHLVLLPLRLSQLL